ncbi:unnamed protein product [Kuraishia capsulata CBS 1993]|uniref:Glycosyltransferase family 34 protein n=1 Tax=Kuraishia capsulata CBS 1993 TaxID=1382522 RepID=W6MGT4_9ASCO|nr:uncharacterized protein KUCA_T00001363001 [Kuraishia capsulata CBS 1993]CDK25394.1 unnamed protein product [Kuraishia capsulata CBS 1993]
MPDIISFSFASDFDMKQGKGSKPLRTRLNTAFRYYKSRLVAGDIRALSQLVVIVVVFILLFWGLAAKQSPSSGKVKKTVRRNFFDTANSQYHQVLNDQIKPNTESVAGFGFGMADYRKLHKKPGTPPTPEVPGVYCELEQDSVDLAKRSSSAFPSLNMGKERKVYIILGKNYETGIKNSKSKESWIIEKFSIINKKHYAEKHGYELTITSSMYDKDGKSLKNHALHQKKYQHEFREGWEKFDLLRKVMRVYSDQPEDTSDSGIEEWYWYVDMYTLIMEPQVSLDDLIFNQLDLMYRNMEYFNPNNLLVDEEPSSHSLRYEPKNDEDAHSIDLILTQDCGGINLNSFLIKKSQWSNLLLDLLWDPVFYKQMHVKWINSGHRKKYGFSLNSNEYNSNGYNNDEEEKNCLEYFYTTQTWFRSKIGFMPIRAFNSLSEDFCMDIDDDEELEALMKASGQSSQLGEQGKSSKLTTQYLNNKKNFHYNETDRDFLINFMNCEKHQSCWDRFQQFSTIYEDLHKSWYHRLF